MGEVWKYASFLKILLVEDHPDGRKSVVQAIKRHFPHAVIHVVRTPQELEVMLRQGDFNIILSAHTPPWDLQQIRSRYPCTPLILLTASASPETAALALQTGAEDCLVKSPEGLERLPQVVMQAMERMVDWIHAAHLQRFYQHAPVGFFTADVHKQLVMANPRFARLVGVIQEDLPGQSLLTWIHPEDRPRLVQATQGLTTEPITLELRLNTRPWPRWTRWQVWALGEEGGFVQGVVEDIHDKRVQHRVQQALTEALHSSAGRANPRQALTAALQALTQATEAQLGVIYLLDDAQARLEQAAVVGPPAYQKALPDSLPIEAPPQKTALRQRRPLLVSQVPPPWGLKRVSRAAAWHMMLFPLTWDVHPLGFLALLRMEDPPFEEVVFRETARASGDFASLVLEIRRRTRERTLRQEVEQAHQLIQAFYQATLDLGSVLRADEVWPALVKGFQPLGWRFAAFRIARGALWLEAHNLSPTIEERLGFAEGEQPHWPLEQWPLARQALEERTPLFSPAVWKRVTGRLPPSLARSLRRELEAQGIVLDGRTSLAYLPLFVQGRPWGMLLIWSPHLTPKDLPALETFSRQISLILEKAFLLEESARQAQRSQALAELSTALVAAHDEKALAHAVVQRLQRHFACSQALLYAREPNGDLRLLAQAAEVQVEAPPLITADQAQQCQAFSEGRQMFLCAPEEGVALCPHLIPAQVATLIGTNEELLGLLLFTLADATDINPETMKMLQTVADVTAIAWQKVRLLQHERRLSQTQEALRTVLLELAQELEPQRLHQAIIGHARTLAGLQGAALWLADGTDAPWRRQAMQGTFEEGSRPPPVPPEALVQWSVEHQKPEAHRQYFPLIAHGKVTAALEAEWPERPSREQRERLALLSTQVAVALENALLFAQTRRDAYIRQVLFIASREIASASLEPEAVYRHIHKAVEALLGGDAFILARYAPGSGQIQIPYAYEQGKRLPSQQVPLDCTSLFGYVVTQKQAVVVRDLEAEAAQLPFRFRQVGYPMRSILAVPLMHHRQPIGAVSVQARRPYAFDEEHLHLLQALASQVGVALENAMLYEQTHRLAITDELTGLYNRRYLFALGTREVKRAARFHHPLTAIMLDLDDFKRINDTYSHAVGDEVLRLWAQRVALGVREVDILGRYGGEEFGLFLPETPLSDALRLAHRLRKLVASTPFETSVGKLWLTMSVGLAVWHPPIQTAAALLQEADYAQYEAKRAGKNRVAWRDPETLTLQVEPHE